MNTALIFATLLLQMPLGQIQGQQTEKIPEDLTKADRFIWTLHRDDFEAFKKAADELAVNTKVWVQDRLTPLSYAVANGRTQHTDYLLEKGAKVNARNKDGSTALMHAARWRFDLQGVSPIIVRLLKEGADVRAKDDTGMTALHYAASWPQYDFGYQGQEDAYARTLEFLVKHGAAVDAKDNLGMTPLLHAARRWHYEPVVKLVELGADPRTTDKLNRSALTFVATFIEDNRTLKFLKDAGAPVGPIEHLLMGQADEALAMLKGGTEALAHGPSGESPLALAAITGNVALVQAVLKYKTSVNHVDDRGETAMMAATGVSYSVEQTGLNAHSVLPSEIGAREMIVALLKQAGADPNAYVKSEREYSLRPVDETPLYRAVGSGNIKLVSALLDAGAKPDGRGDRAPLALASTLLHTEIVILLLERGADPKIGYPIRELFTGPTYEWPEHGKGSAKEILKLLLDAGSDLSFPDRYGKVSGTRVENALHYAVEDVECLRMILDKGVDVNLQDGYKETPLMIASRQGAVESVRELLKRGADKSFRNVHGRTALDMARLKNKHEVVDLLSG